MIGTMSETGPLGVFVGLATLDVAQYLPHAPGPDEKVTAEVSVLSAGGPATNAALTFDAMGGRARLVTALARDGAGDLVRAELRRSGVALVEVANTRSTPVSAIAVATVAGTRSVIGSDARGEDVPPPEHAWITRVLDGAAVLLLDGHHPATAVAFARRAWEMGIPVVVDVGRWKPVFTDLAPLATHLVCSAGARVPGTEDQPFGADATAHELLQGGAQHVVMTAGAGSVRLWHGAEMPSGAHLIPVPPVSAVDTLGAGDAFHGAYAHAVARGLPAEDAVAEGIRVAGIRVVTRGPRAWMADLRG